MTYICPYLSPLGKLLLAADELSLTGIDIKRQLLQLEQQNSKTSD